MSVLSSSFIKLSNAFINTFIKKTKIKQLKSIDFLSALPFYEELSIIKTHQVFKGYAMSYKVEIIDKKDPLTQLEASKSSIKDLFDDILDKPKGFKYQINVKILLKNTKALKFNFLQFVSF